MLNNIIYKIYKILKIFSILFSLSSIFNCLGKNISLTGNEIRYATRGNNNIIILNSNKEILLEIYWKEIFQIPINYFL